MGEVATGLVLFTRDLRVHDQPALAMATRSFARVVPLFVLDPALMGSANRVRFLLQALADLDSSLHSLGSRLIVRSGDPATVAVTVAREAGAAAIWLSADVSAYAKARERRLRDRGAGIEVRLFPGVTVVPPGEVLPAGGDHFKVFTPYHRAWRLATWRRTVAAPQRLGEVADVQSEHPPELPRAASSELPDGGESAGRARMQEWLEGGLHRYAELHDDLPGDGTSRLSPYLHFGCISPLELATSALSAGGEAFVRQLCWRDFHHQVLNAVPSASSQDYRPRGGWRHDPAVLAAWKAGRTGIPIVDAGMRQLSREGWMHNRARLLVASLLTKNLGIDWRDGAAHFQELLVDGDYANNSMNWQWVAGTGNDTRPNRVFNPIRQAQRFDPNGDYVRRYLTELASVEGAAVHEPWLLEPLIRRSLDYPEPIVAPSLRRRSAFP